jgi:predicted DNA-binding transcriptional regulator AlpA
MNTHQQSATNLLTEHEVAPMLGVSPATLRSWRCRGIGPPYVKLGRGPKSPVRYNRGDIEQYIAQCRHVPLVRAAGE